MRTYLAAFLERIEVGEWPLLPLAAPNPWVSRGVGHFHLASELFIQLAGWTDFEFPHTRLRLNAGEAVLLPPQLLHQERIGASDGGEAFSNMVVYAEGGGLRCHLACEAEPGVPGIAHLELRYHTSAQRIHDWLIAASDLFARQPTFAQQTSGALNTLPVDESRQVFAGGDAEYI